MSKEPKTRVGPSFHKGDVVRQNGMGPPAPLWRHCFGWRESTAAENAAWYEEVRRVRASGSRIATSPVDSAGELPLPPRYQTFEIKNGTIGLVTRGRVAGTSPVTAGKSGLCEVFWPDLGETLIVPKNRLEHAW
jgi:hypothetical protein